MRVLVHWRAVVAGELLVATWSMNAASVTRSRARLFAGTHRGLTLDPSAMSARGRQDA